MAYAGFSESHRVLGGRYFDVSGDGRIDNLDALQLINHLLAPALIRSSSQPCKS